MTIRADVWVEAWGDGELDVALTVSAPDMGSTYEARSKVANDMATLAVRVDAPLLWWPNGYGEHPLYRVSVRLEAEGRTADEREYKIGLRTVELRQEDDAWGRSFTFVVNGEPIFAKGSNWIPADAFVTRVSNGHLDHLIRSVAATHQSMLRVWGGGLYEEDRFYDLCDRYGILVWQDFVFACSTYPLDELDFLENVRIEIEENVRRLRSRACLALWCGNNEMEWFWESRGRAVHDAEDELRSLADRIPALGPLREVFAERDLLPDWRDLRDAYERFFHETLADWLAKLDPDTAYWPSSPSSNTPFHDVNGERRGDAHYWEVWHGRKPFTAYRTSLPRFMSEFGFQAFPTLETIESYAAPEDRNLTSRVMEHHQRGRHGNGLIIAQMAESFRMPSSFDSWIYLSQVLQAEGIRHGVEHWRRNMDRVGGTLYWQLNDCWPAASWSSIDFFGRWKALHYAAERFYAPVLLSVEDKPPLMDLHVSNDRPEPWAGTVRWRLETLGGEVVDSEELTVTAAPLSDVLVASLDFGTRLDEQTKRALVLVAELRRGEDRTALSVHPFVPSKHLDLEDPRIDVRVEARGEELVVRLIARSLARFVELKLTNVPDVVFTDNYFDLPAGRAVEIGCPMPSGWSESEVRTSLSVRTLVDTYKASSAE